MGDIFEKSIKLSSIDKAAQRAQRGSSKKTASKIWKVERIERCGELRRKILTGRYRPGHGPAFEIFEPKRREIVPPLYVDKVWQHAMCLNGVYEAFTKPLIWDSTACQKGKGTELAILRMIAALERYYRKHGDNNGVVRHLDVRRYFPSTPNAEAKKVVTKYIADPEIVKQLNMVIDSFPDTRPKAAIQADPFGKRGTALGSIISQLVQLAMLDELDHTLSATPGVEYYQRTMDDIVVITREPAVADKAANMAEAYLRERGLEMTEKGGNTRLHKGFYYLKRKFILTSSGRVLVVPDKGRFHKECRVLRKYKGDLEEGTKTLPEIQKRYECWLSSLLLCDCGERVRKMDDYIYDLFGEKPNYKLPRKARRKTMIKRTTTARIRELEAENARLKAENEMLKADMDYVAMMTDVELEDDEEVSPDAQPEV